MDLDAYRARAQVFATALNRAHHRRFAGLGGAWDPPALYARHTALYDDRAIAELRGAAEQAEPPGDGVRRLLRFAVEARLGAVIAPATAARARAEAETGLAELTAALATEDGAAQRARLEEQRLDVVAERLQRPAAVALERVRAEARALGWPSARAMYGALHGVDLGALGAEAERLLRETAPPALPGDARARHDLPRVHRAAWADERLPEPVAHLRTTLQRLSLPERFGLDAAPRPGKSPRAFCAAVVVPGDVHLVVAPRGGLPDLEAVFHEAGHAVHLSLRDPGAPFEDRHLVDPVRAETLAFAFEALALGDDADEGLRRHREAMATLRARRLAAALLHDLDLLDEGAHPALRERYARRMAAATGLDWPTVPWLTAADPLLSSAVYLRALGRAPALGGAALRAALVA